jgi:hypothetical protein
MLLLLYISVQFRVELSSRSKVAITAPTGRQGGRSVLLTCLNILAGLVNYQYNIAGEEASNKTNIQWAENIISNAALTQSRCDAEAGRAAELVASDRAASDKNFVDTGTSSVLNPPLIPSFISYLGHPPSSVMELLEKETLVQSTTTTTTTTTTTIHMHNEPTEVLLLQQQIAHTTVYQKIVTSVKRTLLGALNADIRNNMEDVLTVPFVILHAPIDKNRLNKGGRQEASLAPVANRHECALCGCLVIAADDDEAQSSFNSICHVCETQAYILFSNGLALSSPSQKSSKMKLNHVLLPANHNCLVPEWSGHNSSPGLSATTESSCTCGFCWLLIEDKTQVVIPTKSLEVLSRLLGWMTTNTTLWQVLQEIPQSLKMFKYIQRSSQLGWNNEAEFGDQHYQLVWTIASHYIPSIAMVS